MTFWNEVRCTAFGHPGTWTAEPTLWSLDPTVPPWRCSRCRMTLADMVREDRDLLRSPGWLERLGW